MFKKVWLVFPARFLGKFSVSGCVAEEQLSSAARLRDSGVDVFVRNWEIKSGSFWEKRGESRLLFDLHNKETNNNFYHQCLHLGLLRPVRVNSCSL